MFLDPAELEKDYAKCPAWLRASMRAWADGLDCCLATHPDQAERYAQGDLWPVYFSPDDLDGHIERRYRPGT